MRLSFNLLSAALLLAAEASAKSVFAHYMVGGVLPANAQIDVDQAKALGIDAFALNLGAPDQWWAINAVKGLFDAANKSGFKLFFSMDFYQQNNLTMYTSLINQYKGNAAYLKINGKPVMSSFSTGTHTVDEFKSWKSQVFGNNVYFLPNADSTPGYNNPSNFLQTWGQVVDGLFGWETGWPGGSRTPANVSSQVDKSVQTAAHNAQKSYMAPLSSLQFKACCGGHYYRIGEINLPMRMEELIALQPDFVEVLTWNDAGESHYIANNWPETLGNNPEISAYSNNQDWSHAAWQPLIASFISAYKGNGVLAPVGGAKVTGAMWYRTVLKSAGCSKPANWESALDSVNYAIIFGQDAGGSKIRVTSGGRVLREVAAKPGLNYAAVEGMQQGAQKVEVVSSNGATTLVAASKVDVNNNDSNCYFNYKVVGLQS